METLAPYKIVNFPMEDLATLTFYFVVIIYIIFTVIFYYHWNAYSSNKQVTTYTLTVYFVTTVPLLLILGILTLMI